MKRHVALLTAVVAANGCAFTTMLPAHKLESGDVVAQVSVDEPGFLYLPRLGAQVTFGTGWADFSAHAGTAIANVNAGGTARLYLGAWALSLQGDMLVTTFEEDLFSSGTRFGFITATPRFGRVLSGDQRFYGGFQLLGILPFNIDEGADLPSGPGIAAGGYFGYAWDSPGNIDFQVEGSAAPISTFPGVYTEDESYGVGLAPIVQLGVAIQYRKEKHPPAPASPEPLGPPKSDPIL